MHARLDLFCADRGVEVSGVGGPGDVDARARRQGCVDRPDPGLAAVVTFVVTASRVAVLGIGAAFWGLLAGLTTLLVLRRRQSTVDPDVLPGD